MGYKRKSTTKRGRSQDRKRKSSEKHEIAYRKMKKKIGKRSPVKMLSAKGSRKKL